MMNFMLWLGREHLSSVATTADCTDEKLQPTERKSSRPGDFDGVKRSLLVARNRGESGKQLSITL